MPGTDITTGDRRNADAEGMGKQALQEREAAQTIVKRLMDPAPDWLVETITAKVVPTLRMELFNALFSRERRSLTKQIKKAVEGYVDLIDVILNSYVQSQIPNHWPSDVPKDGCSHLINALFKYGDPMRQTLEGVGASLSRQSGRGRLSVQFHGKTPGWCCAAYALIIWRAVRPEPLRPGMQSLHSLCAGLWLAAGGTRESEPSWRYQIKSVLSHLSEDESVDRSPARRWFRNEESTFNEVAMSYHRRHDETR